MRHRYLGLQLAHINRHTHTIKGYTTESGHWSEKQYGCIYNLRSMIHK